MLKCTTQNSKWGRYLDWENEKQATRWVGKMAKPMPRREGWEKIKVLHVIGCFMPAGETGHHCLYCLLRQVGTSSAWGSFLWLRWGRQGNKWYCSVVKGWTERGASPRQSYEQVEENEWPFPSTWCVKEYSWAREMAECIKVLSIPGWWPEFNPGNPQKGKRNWLSKLPSDCQMHAKECQYASPPHL